VIPTPRINTAQQSTPQTVPAPVGGLNGRDPLADMDKKDAYVLDNILPGTASVASRKGCIKYTVSALGAPGPVQSLEVYAGGAGDKMLAWAGGKIYDISTPVPSVLKTGLLTNVVVATMFSNAADTSQHMIIASGVDLMSHYDGATITDLTMTGMTGSATTLNYVKTFKGRLYIGQRDKLGFYFLPVGALQGALSYFDLAQQSQLGGYLVAIGTYSEDNGNTPNDYIVFITSKGECIVYGGYDPGAAANWTLVGRYYTATPIGPKCTINYASELVILTTQGAIGFSKIRATGSAMAGTGGDDQYTAITSKLGSYLSDYNVNATVPGWEGIQYTSGSGGWLLLNVPATGSLSGAYYHYVMNTVTNAWCRFTNWNGLCFCVYNRKLYFGRYDGYVMQGDVGGTDDGQSVLIQAKQAYNYFEDGSGIGFLRKHFQWASLLVSSNSTPAIACKYSVDFVDIPPEYVNSLVPSAGATWDVGAWDLASWGGTDDGNTQRVVVTLNTAGVAGSMWMRVALNGITFQWYATQYVIEKTKGLLL
jgi:hypothetical protein